MKNRKYMNWFYAAAITLTSFSMVACEDEPDKYEIAGGHPVLKYVRVPLPESGDSLLTGAYMDNTICLVGENLRSIVELYFNDQKAVLNTSYMTDHTILVDVPGNIPVEVTDKMYMITSGKDTIPYDFKVLVPGPAVNSLSCEFAPAGSEVTIYGDYFIDDPNVPLTITMAGNVPVTNITNITKTAVSFILPNNAPAGYINVQSIYGVGRSKFQYLDTRGMLFDWDGSRGGMSLGWGWRDGSKLLVNDGEGIDGAYIKMQGDLSGEIGATWAEDAYCFNYWPDAANGHPAVSDIPEIAELLEAYDVNGLQMKFECKIPASNPWASAALQMIFTSDADVTYATGTNAYYSTTTVPRGLWMPWKNSGSYDTADKWVTVSVPLSEFNKTHEGAACDKGISKDTMTGLTFFVWHGGVAGTDCSPIICIDNIRLVPIEK